MENTNNTAYEVTKTFTSGLLAGITITEKTTVKFTVGQEVKQPIGGSPYRVMAVKEVL